MHTKYMKIKIIIIKNKTKIINVYTNIHESDTANVPHHNMNVFMNDQIYLYRWCLYLWFIEHRR